MLTSVISAQTVQFEDPNLEKTVQNELSVDSPISEQQMLGLTRLNARKLSIKSLDGLRYAKNLNRLIIENNEISDISELTELKELETLFLSSNKITRSFANCEPGKVAALETG